MGSEGPDLFGIGNNMVKSLRYWMKAFKLIEENPGVGAKLSELGKIILQNDVYLEKKFYFMDSAFANCKKYCRRDYMVHVL